MNRCDICSIKIDTPITMNGMIVCKDCADGIKRDGAIVEVWKIKS